MRKKIDYKKIKVQLKKRHPIKSVNQYNLSYLNKPANHVNRIERTIKNKK